MFDKWAETDSLPAPAAEKRRGRVWNWCVSVFVLAMLVRLGLILPRSREQLTRAEPVNIAVSLVTTGKYADAYGPGVGPTAHSAPLHPLLLSVAFRIFGTGAHGELAMSVLGSIAASVAFALLPALAVASGFGLFSGALAGVAGALLPINFWCQTSGAFDAPFTAAMLVLLSLLLCRIWAVASFRTHEAVVFGLAAGVGCLLNPVLIPVLAAWSIASVVRYRQHLRRVLVFLAVSTLCFLVVLAPWAIRNYRALGALIWTRSNFGLELQVSNNDLLTADLERNVRLPAFGLLHPFLNIGERAKVRAVGEVAYQRSKRQEAFAWIASHKGLFLWRSAERFRLFWFPRMSRVWQSAFEIALTIAGLGGLLLLFWEQCAFAWIFGAAAAAYPAVYYVIQVSPRYRFPLECILFLLAARMAGFMFAWSLWRFRHPASEMPR